MYDLTTVIDQDDENHVKHAIGLIDSIGKEKRVDRTKLLIELDMHIPIHTQGVMTFGELHDYAIKIASTLKE